MTFQTIVTAGDPYEFYKRCKEKEDDNWKLVGGSKQYNTIKQYNHKSNSHTRLNRTTFAGVEERTKYRAVYRREQS